MSGVVSDWVGWRPYGLFVSGGKATVFAGNLREHLVIDEQDACRQLLAHAELLAACKGLLANGCGGHWPQSAIAAWDKAVGAAEAAIGKAERKLSPNLTDNSAASPTERFQVTEQEVVTLMGSSKSHREWHDNSDRVKTACGGRYPAFWHDAVMASGLADRVFNSWPTESLSPPEE